MEHARREITTQGYVKQNTEKLRIIAKEN
jgi:hypothetical protein